MKAKNLCKAVWILALLCFPVSGWSAGLTQAQYDLLKTDITITNQAEFAQDVADSADQKIADAYNTSSSPSFWVWKTSLREQEVYEQTSSDNTTWNWATYKAQTVQDRDSWARMFNPGVVNPSLKQTRDGWLAIFGGQGASQQQVNFLLALGRRVALRNEALFANTSAGNGSTATPANLTYEGQITYRDVAYALRGGQHP